MYHILSGCVPNCTRLLVLFVCCLFLSGVEVEMHIIFFLSGFLLYCVLSQILHFCLSMSFITVQKKQKHIGQMKEKLQFGCCWVTFGRVIPQLVFNWKFLFQNIISTSEKVITCTSSFSFVNKAKENCFKDELISFPLILFYFLTTIIYKMKWL